jgi:hypothetical protein
MGRRIICTDVSGRSRDRAVGIAAGYGLDDRGVGVPSPGRVKNFLFSTSSRQALGHTHTASYPKGTVGSLPRVKAAGE